MRFSSKQPFIIQTNKPNNNNKKKAKKVNTTYKGWWGAGRDVGGEKNKQQMDNRFQIHSQFSLAGEHLTIAHLRICIHETDATN